MSGFICDFHFINSELMNTSILALAFFAENSKKAFKQSPVLSAVEAPQPLTQTFHDLRYLTNIQRLLKVKT